MATPQTASQTPSRLQEILKPSDRIEDLSDSEYTEGMEAAAAQQVLEKFPHLQLLQSPLKDDLETFTSEVQDETLEAVIPFLEGNPYELALNSFGLPTLQRPKHVAFLKNALGRYPPQFAAIDAARPWLLYWSLQGLTALGEDVSEYREQVTYTFSAAQHPGGGFGGGHGQLPHLAAAYAAILSLVIVGGEESYSMINRKSMWHYLGRMKQLDGGFTMSPGGEEDIRGAFCALVIISLLNLPLDLPPDSPSRVTGTETFLTNLGEWISRCQSYEGGLAAAPNQEAHGAYAFCGLGCLCVMGAPYETMPKYLNMDSLLRWLSSRQMGPEGGFAGRTNKLVDGCYNHWIGSCWALVEAASAGPEGNAPTSDKLPKRLWDRGAMARYILSAAQGKKGGLRDKPGKPPDAYHTCYNLAGLSAAQHRYAYNDSSKGSVGGQGLDAAFGWRVVENENEEGRMWDKGDETQPVHPVFIVPIGQVEKCREFFVKREGF